MTTSPSNGTYIMDNGTLYFVIGKTKIKVTEHFPTGGPTVTDLLEGAISYSAKYA